MTRRARAAPAGVRAAQPVAEGGQYRLRVGGEGGTRRARREVRVAGREARRAPAADDGRAWRVADEQAQRGAVQRAVGGAGEQGEGGVSAAVHGRPRCGRGARHAGRTPPPPPAARAAVVRPPVDGPAHRRRLVLGQHGEQFVAPGCARPPAPRSGRPGPGAGGCAAAPARPSRRSRAGSRAAGGRRRTSALRSGCTAAGSAASKAARGVQEPRRRAGGPSASEEDAQQRRSTRSARIARAVQKLGAQGIRDSGGGGGDSRESAAILSHGPGSPVPAVRGAPAAADPGGSCSRSSATALAGSGSPVPAVRALLRRGSRQCCSAVRAILPPRIQAPLFPQIRRSCPRGSRRSCSRRSGARAPARTVLSRRSGTRPRRSSSPVPGDPALLPRGSGSLTPTLRRLGRRASGRSCPRDRGLPATQLDPPVPTAPGGPVPASLARSCSCGCRRLCPPAPAVLPPRVRAALPPQVRRPCVPAVQPTYRREPGGEQPQDRQVRPARPVRAAGFRRAGGRPTRSAGPSSRAWATPPAGAASWGVPCCRASSSRAWTTGPMRMVR